MGSVARYPIEVGKMQPFTRDSTGDPSPFPVPLVLTTALLLLPGGGYDWINCCCWTMGPVVVVMVEVAIAGVFAGGDENPWW